MEQGDWPVQIIATQDVACGARLWSASGRRRATFVAKATFFLVRGGAMRLVNPAPILLGDQHHEGSVDRSVLAASDMAPYLPRAEAMFSGHAYAPTPSPFVPVRFAVVGSRPLIDKTLHVFGERMWLEGDQTTAPVPFTRIPIRWERAYRGPAGFEENPLGMPRGANLAVHNLHDPHDPEAPAGLGPIAPYWPPRRRLLRNLEPSVLAVPEPALPDTFAWSFFHAAPPDQRCSFFEGNEWVVLEGLHPEHPRFESQLPNVRARARIYGADSTGFREIGLSADTLWVDGDRSLCCLLWRGNFEVESDEMLASAQIFAGLEMPGRPIPWPDRSSKPAPIAEVAPAAPAPDYDATLHAAASPLAASAVKAPEAALPYVPVRQPSGVMPAFVQPVTPATPPVTPEPAPPRASRLAALADDPAPVPAGTQPPVAQPPVPQPAAARSWVPGSTMASVGVQQIAELRGLVDAPPVVTSISTPEPPHAPGPESITNVQRDPRLVAMLDAQAAGAQPAPGSFAPASSPVSMSSTVTQPPSELRKLLNEAEQAPSAQPPAAEMFEDSPTVAPEMSDIARIVEEAEALAIANEARATKQEPVGTRPSPAQLAAAMRGQRTTIRGLGSDKLLREAAELAPTTARAPLQSPEAPTAQLPIPDVLLKLAAEPSSARPPLTDAEPAREPPPSVQAVAQQAPSSPVIRHAAVELDDLDEDETGRPTLTGMEAPPMSQVGASPQVHHGETRMEIERRIREGESLDGLDMSDLDLSGFDFSGKSLQGCRFDRANLKRCRLHGANLTGASLEGTDLGEAVLDEAVLERTNLVAAKLTGASLRATFLTDANLTTIDGRRAAFDRASGQRTLMCRARLDGASFVGSQLDGADLTEAQVDGASFEGSLLPDLRGYELSAEDATFSRVNLRNARFDGAVMTRARFDQVIADDTMWDRAVLDGVDFQRAALGGASFTKASLRGADFSHAMLAESRFNRANLSGAKLVGVEMELLTLDGADLSGIVTNE